MYICASALGDTRKMAKFEVKIDCGVFDRSYTFEGSEAEMWADMKEKFDRIAKFVVYKNKTTSIAGYDLTLKVWWGSMKNGRISKTLLASYSY